MTTNRYHPCLDNYLPEYLNRKDVRAALHVDLDAKPWKQCADNIQYSHEDHMASMMPVHRYNLLFFFEKSK
jgi:hypothetical protein